MIVLSIGENTVAHLPKESVKPWDKLPLFYEKPRNENNVVDLVVAVVAVVAVLAVVVAVSEAVGVVDLEEEVVEEVQDLVGVDHLLPREHRTGQAEVALDEAVDLVDHHLHHPVLVLLDNTDLRDNGATGASLMLVL